MAGKKTIDWKPEHDAVILKNVEQARLAGANMRKAFLAACEELAIYHGIDTEFNKVSMRYYDLRRRKMVPEELMKPIKESKEISEEQIESGIQTIEQVFTEIKGLVKERDALVKERDELKQQLEEAMQYKEQYAELQTKFNRYLRETNSLLKLVKPSEKARA